jgi:hypothetical protein
MKRHGRAGLGGIFTIVLALVAAPTVAAGPPTDRDRASSAVVRDWEQMAVDTIFPVKTPPFPTTQTAIPVGALYLGFTSLAMYRAAEAAGRRGSAEAAVATAAHDVLTEYFPGSAESLKAKLSISLEAVPDGWAKLQGQQAGARAAAELIASRVDDGRNATTPVYQRDPAPGVWQPAPGGAMLAPWLGFVKPVLLRQPIDPRGVNGPPALTSITYAVEFAEVKRVGSTTSTARTTEQTQTAQFFNSNSAIMVTEGLLNYLDTRPMGLRDSVQLFAAMHSAMSDSIISCWRLKYDVGFWRPVQAIQNADSDGNPRTVADTNWTPLIPNPPYSDYVSGHGCLTAPAVQAIRRTLGERTSLTLHSYVTNTDQDFASLRELEHDAFYARIWGGLHFRTAMRDAYDIGHTAADQVLLKLR